MRSAAKPVVLKRSHMRAVVCLLLLTLLNCCQPVTAATSPRPIVLAVFVEHSIIEDSTDQETFRGFEDELVLALIARMKASGYKCIPPSAIASAAARTNYKYGLGEDSSIRFKNRSTFDKALTEEFGPVISVTLSLRSKAKNVGEAPPRPNGLPGGFIFRPSIELMIDVKATHGYDSSMRTYGTVSMELDGSYESYSIFDRKAYRKFLQTQKHEVLIEALSKRASSFATTKLTFMPLEKYVEEAQKVVSATSLYKQGMEAEAKNASADAIRLYKRACELDYTQADASLRLGRLCFKMHKYQDAVLAFNNYLLCSKPLDVAVVKERDAADASLSKQSANPAEYRESISNEFTGSGEGPVKDKWALVIGISKFANPKYNLRFASKDARDFYSYLVSDAGFRKDHVLLLTDEKATKTNIMDAFGDNFLPAVTEPGDMVVVFVSTHGTPARRDKAGQNYIVAYDTDATKLYATGVDMDELYKRLKDGVKTDRALIVMDTCYSGAGIPGAKALNVYDNFDAKEIAQGCGHRVMTSSSPNEPSRESKTSSNGVFTKYLLQALRTNKKVDVKSAFEQLQPKVQWEVKSVWGESQTPQLGGQWDGQELILSVPATSPRPVLDPDLLRLMRSTQPQNNPAPQQPAMRSSKVSGRK